MPQLPAQLIEYVYFLSLYGFVPLQVAAHQRFQPPPIVAPDYALLGWLCCGSLWCA
jgi:hypothetical protein